MAALWMARCGIKTRVIDRREEHVRAGHADGIQCRTLEILESFDIVNQIWKESCHMAEVRFNATMRFWKRIWEYRTDQS